MFNTTGWYTVFYYENLDHEKTRRMIEEVCPAVEPTSENPSPCSKFFVEAMVKAHATRSFCSPLREPSPVDGLPSPRATPVPSPAPSTIMFTNMSMSMVYSDSDESDEFSDSAESESSTRRSSKTPKWSPTFDEFVF